MASGNSSKDFDLPVPRKIRASASLVLLCVAMGILIGYHSGFTPHFTEETANKQTLEQFRDRYHLYSVRNEDLMMMKMFAN